MGKLLVIIFVYSLAPYVAVFFISLALGILVLILLRRSRLKNIQKNENVNPTNYQTTEPESTNTVDHQEKKPRDIKKSLLSLRYFGILNIILSTLSMILAWPAFTDPALGMMGIIVFPFLVFCASLYLIQIIRVFILSKNGLIFKKLDITIHLTPILAFIIFTVVVLLTITSQ